MTLAAFLQHWSLSEHPFRGEEARQDPVFSRLALLPAPSPTDRPFGPVGLPRAGANVQHPDFEKIAGDFALPSAAIVFGEKGSGKTAIRLQLAEHIAAHNAAPAHAGRRVLLVPFDHLNDILDRFVARVRPSIRDKNATIVDVLKRFRLADHVDGILARAVPRVVDAVLGDAPARPASSSPGAVGATAPAPAGESASRVDIVRAGADGKPPPSADLKRFARALDLGTKHDLLQLQAVYDRPDDADDRTRRLRRRLGLRRSWIDRAESLWVALGWLAPAAVLAQYIRDGHIRNGQPDLDPIWTTAFFTALAVWVLFLFKRALSERLIIGRIASRLRRQIRVIPRSERSYARSIRQLPRAARAAAALPLTDAEDQRYAMLDRLRRVLAAIGYSGVIVVVDRLDEPSAIAGDVERMRAIAWPLLNNKFLQQEGLGIKLLLPAELRHVLYRESAAFFQEARLDKQCLVERLAWSGPMLYDLCTARLNACRPAGAQPISLSDLFADDVTRGDIVDALEQMHQPRDAFKLLYACIAEHCSNVTADQAAFKVGKPVLDMIRKQQTERVRQLYMGVRPA
ncbi:MAG: hypothetical protein AB7K52_13940 [Phycisphaerales bacterium]